MVVLSSAILSSSKPLLSRQFVEMPRVRVEGLLSAFTKLIEHESKDHTYIETETVRYVYQPLENLYILLITNRLSNIIEDIDTLRLMASMIQDIAQVVVTEELILEHAFDILFGFDEIVSFGYRDSVTLAQIKAYTEMDSHEEKLQTIILQTKENDEKERRKKIAEKLEKEKASPRREEIKNLFPSISSTPIVPEMQSQSNTFTLNNDSTVPKRGMQINANDSKPKLFEGIRTRVDDSSLVCEEAAPAVANPLLDPVEILIEEKITGSMHCEGGIEELDIQGTFQVTVNDPHRAELAAFQVSPEDKRFKFRLHPHLNKGSHSRGILELKDPTKAFKINTPAPLLKWRMQTKQEDWLPFTLSCWVTGSTDDVNLTTELECTDPENHPIQDIDIQFSCPKSFCPNIISVENGVTEHDGMILHWKIPYMDTDVSSGTLEFTVNTDSSTVLPFTVEAIGVKTLCNFEINSCYNQTNQEPIAYSMRRLSCYSLRVDL